MRGARWVFAIGAWAACTATLGVVCVGKVEAIRSSFLAATSGNRSSTPSPAPPSPSPGAAQLLRTPGGTILARCDAGMTWADYLRPALRFHIENAQQGPGVEYRVTFKTDGQEVRVVVHCDTKTLIPTADVTLG
ncbi:hypothetical protein [Dactylosporangium sp. NPDC000521]|uniref:hypothetical protein n=1 Tax=Dactylosporangium sp. NPDC000521 TaxID=3363975 RepID=UPI0036BF5D3F